MISSALFGFIGATLLFFLYLFPQAQSLPPQIGQAVQWVVDNLYDWSWLFPVEAFFQVLLLALAFHTGIFAFKGIKYIINVIRGSGA